MLSILLFGSSLARFCNRDRRLCHSVDGAGQFQAVGLPVFHSALLVKRDSASTGSAPGINLGSALVER